MPDVKEIVREMLQRGMSQEEILSALQDIGIENPESVLAEAMKSAKGEEGEETPAEGEAPAEAPAEEPRVVEEREMEQTAAAASATLSAETTAALDAKMDEALALLKSLQELNKKILEANRDILLRLKK